MLEHPTPTVALVAGRPYWSWPDGSLAPVLRGGADNDPAGGAGGGGTGTATDDGKGGAGTDDGKGAAGTDDGKGSKDEPLGAPGLAALQSERDAREAAEREAKAAKKALEDLQAEHATEEEKKLKAARDEGSAEATAKANARILKSEVKVLATGKLADPSDAVALLDLTKFEVDADGNVDEKKIASAIEALLKEKPHLAARAKRTGDGGGGPRGAEAETDSMDDRIRRAAGR